MVIEISVVWFIGPFFFFYIISCLSFFFFNFFIFSLADNLFIFLSPPINIFIIINIFSFINLYNNKESTSISSSKSISKSSYFIAFTIHIISYYKNLEINLILIFQNYHFYPVIFQYLKSLGISPV